MILYANTSNQELFNDVVKHLLTQNKKSVHIDEYGEEHCAYRGENGTSCAVGCKVPDELYNINMEGISVLSHYFYDIFTQKQQEFMQELQRIHDNCSVTIWKHELKRMAKEHKLTFPKEFN